MKISANSDAQRALGILTFKVSGIPETNSQVVVTVDIDGEQVQSCSVDTIRGTSLNLNVHTHLLGDRRHKLSVCVQHPEFGIRTASTKFRVQNDAPLSRPVANLLTEHKVPVVFSGACDSSRYPYDSTAVMPWFDRPDAGAHIDRLLLTKEISTGDAEILRKFAKDGFVVLDDVIDEEMLFELNREIDQAITQGYQGYRYGSSQRIEHLHTKFPNMRRLWLDRRHLRWADLLFNGRARPCQTLTFVFGSQQDAHQDAIHLTPFPAGYMCGIWIALQDVEDGSGELIVYPGSHREPRIYLRGAECGKVDSDWTEFGRKVVPLWREMSERYEPFVYRPKKGAVLIWHENLLHAGSVRRDKSLERRSVVIHAFADGAIGYYDSTGMAASAASAGENLRAHDGLARRLLEAAVRQLPFGRR